MPSGRIELLEFHARQQHIYNRLGPRNVLRCGRRFGKTTLLESGFAKRAINGRKIGWFTPDYKLMRPTFARIRKMLAPATKSASKVDALIELHGGGSFEFWTLDNEDAGRSRDYDDVVIDEASLKKRGLKEIVDQAILPTLLDRRGTLTMAGTPKGIDPENFFYLACTAPEIGASPDSVTKFDAEKNPLGWREFHAPTRDNPTLDAIGVANLQDEYPPLVYQQEFLAEFVNWDGDAFFSINSLTDEGQPVEAPPVVDAVFATIDTATKTGKENDGTAVVYWALHKVGARHKLTVLDYDIRQIEGALLETWLPTVFQKLEGYTKTMRCRAGSLGAWIEDKASGMVLLQQAMRRNWPARAIDSKLTSVGKSERAINVSGYVFQNMVKFSRAARDNVINYKGVTRNHLEAQVIGFRIGVLDQVDDDLLDAFTYGVAIALGDSGGF